MYNYIYNINGNYLEKDMIEYYDTLNVSQNSICIQNTCLSIDDINFLHSQKKIFQL